jgi:hypothetical protein
VIFSLQNLAHGQEARCRFRPTQATFP